MAEVSIQNLNIKNFRSINLVEAKVAPLTILCGRNDVGKSNVLRALNLFFNGKTNHNTDFDFLSDYNFNTKPSKNKAREIVISVDISLPRSYHKKNGHFIRWTKCWRKDGLHRGEDNFTGFRLSKTPRGKDKLEKVELSNSSNARKLLRRIEFEYVPAVKGARYFDDLRGRIYKTIAEVATKSIRDTSSAFETSIGEHLKELTSDINTSLGIDTNLALPRDLSHIFERLDFLSGNHAVSLENRGDGIKARHIPLILKFMAEKKSELGGAGSIPSTFIWGYEEPENNLELAGAIALAQEVSNLCKKNVAQVILTTHSPAFYDLAKQISEIGLLQAVRKTDQEGTKLLTDSADLDDSLGTLAAIASRLEDARAEATSNERSRAEAKIIAEQKMPVIFVEGKSDALVLTRALEVFFPALKGRIKFKTKSSGGGDNYVIDMLSAWRHQHKHHTTGPKAAGVLDADAQHKRKSFNSVGGNTSSAKCFEYPVPQHLHSAYKSSIKPPIDLEALYPLKVWEAAAKNSLLEERSEPWKFLPTETQAKIFSSEDSLEGYLKNSWKIYVTHKFKNTAKITTAEHLAHMGNKDNLRSFENLLKEVVSYFGLLAESK